MQSNPPNRVSGAVITNRGYCIPVKLLSENDRVKIIDDLTVEPERYIGHGQMYDIYIKTPNYMILPRYYGITTFKSKFKTVNQLTPGETAKFDMTLSGFKLSQVQKEAHSAVLNAFKETGTATIKLDCGLGKTVLGIYIAQQLGINSLVVVHRISLLKQWANEIKKFTNAKIGLMHRTIDTHKGADITVTTIKNVLMKENPDVYKDFGLAIFDEAHHLNAQEFHKVLTRVNCRYCLGLSATPNKGEKVNISHVFKQFLSPIICISDPDDKPITSTAPKPGPGVLKGSARELTPDLSDDFIIAGTQPTPKTNKNVQQKCEVQRKGAPENIVNVMIIRYKKLNGELTEQFYHEIYGTSERQKPNVGKMITNISRNKHRNDYAVSLIKDISADQKRNILVLSDRIYHLRYIYDQLYLAEASVGLFIGGMSIAELEESKTKRIILGSYGVCEEGLSIMKLNVMILLTSRPEIEQSIGRLRIKNKVSDIPLLIYDFVDMFSGTFVNQFRRRRLFYKSQGYNILNYKSID